MNFPLGSSFSLQVFVLANFFRMIFFHRDFAFKLETFFITQGHIIYFGSQGVFRRSEPGVPIAVCLSMG